MRPFPGLTVEDNVIVGGLLHRANVAAAREKAHDLLRRLDLYDKRQQKASSLTLPDRKRLEVARALATDPKLLLLDEVMAGLRPTETDRLVAVLKALNHDTGLTIVLIEHVMRAVMALAAPHRRPASRRADRRWPARGRRARCRRDRVLSRRGDAGMILACRRPRSLLRRRPGARRRVAGIEEGTIVAIVGANGAGKTSLIRTVAGMYRPARGRILYRGEDIAGWPSHRVCDLGIGQVAEGRQVFPSLSVAENLAMGAMLPRARGERQRNLDRVMTMFPRLAERRRQAAGTLSGGEQQMLAIGRCLMGSPDLIMFDEPSLGLAPLAVQGVLKTIGELNASGITCVLVEQNVAASLKLAAHAYVIENGRVVLSGTGEALLRDDRVRQAYLGA